VYGVLFIVNHLLIMFNGFIVNFHLQMYYVLIVNHLLSINDVFVVYSFVKHVFNRV
jgi:hypothetical protein